ncbi:hypothetical protein SAMD00023353_8700060 [Rosellinia necatrix]|uniref:Uncharacterized protein n=1 Tax=Rosellinia necatrix TaxID=77044 RepID=A0A1W2TW06_ROSNE|nr:hypothetical protein SAMD00023353_8700060 [Rosellinia necatrix]
MLPPIDDNILKSNPRFEKLYNTITTSILNPDGSSRADPSAKQRDAVREELKAYRLKAARVHLLRTAISTAVPTQPPQPGKQEGGEQSRQQQKQRQSKYQHGRTKSRSQSQSQIQAQAPQTPSLPPDLVQLLFLIPPFLNNAAVLPPASIKLLLTSPPFTELPALFPKVLELVSMRLAAEAKTLARVLSPSTNPSYIHRVISSLPSMASTLVAELAASKVKLSRARLATTAALTRHLQQHTEALVLLLGALEAKHGPIARASELRAAEARQEAEAWALAATALLWETRHLAYPPEARAALINYRQHLLDAGRRLEDGARVREAELADYGVDVSRRASLDMTPAGNRLLRPSRGGRRNNSVDENKERTMRELARVWREMETRLQEIQGDLKRLR